ncbi:MAG: DNA polymerase/3'-5' exonuclease PolX [Minisyncoccales bacterium]|jgi:DNA polymerase (family 10)
MRENRQLAKIFYEIADYLDMEDLPFRPFAYRRAADFLESSKTSVRELYDKEKIKGLVVLPGIGENIAKKIEEYLKTGEIKYYNRLKKKAPIDIRGLIAIEGVGPKTVKKLYKELNVKTIEDLERVAKEGKVAQLDGFGEKSQKSIIEGIEFLKKTKGRVSLGEALPIADEIISFLSKADQVLKVDSAGSLRRMKETIGDIDILVASDDPQKVMDRFVSMNGVEKIWGVGQTKASIRMREGFNVDLRVVSPDSYGSALQHFTGSKDHNIRLRRFAIEKSMKVNEYGVFKGDKRIAGQDEPSVYKSLKMDYIPPEMREDFGEVELATLGKIPEIIGYSSIKGDLHCHTDWTGGANSMEEMAEKAIELGYSYLGISDHTEFLRVENGLSAQELLSQREKIENLNDKIKKRRSGAVQFKLLHGCEANILEDGSIDIDDQTLEKLDFVIAGIHSNFKMSQDKMTQRLIKAMKNPNIDIIAHPTGRIIGKREAYQLDMNKIFETAIETETILEINASPYRLDLNDLNIRRAVDLGVKMIINSDAHHKENMSQIFLGVAQARRGWAKESDIVNSGDLESLLGSLKR